MGLFQIIASTLGLGASGVLCMPLAYLVAYLCPTLCNPKGCSSGGLVSYPSRQDTGVGSHSFLQGIFQIWDQTQVSCISGRFFTSWTTRETFMVGNTSIPFSQDTSLKSYSPQPSGSPNASPMLCCAVLSHVWFFATPWTLACQAPLSMGSLQARMLDFHALLNASPIGLQSQSSQCRGCSDPCSL